MRKWTSLFALVFLVGCGPPHPTHPTKIDCTFEIEAVYQARIDHSAPGPVNEGEDPCFTGGGFVILETWTQTIGGSLPICVAAATTPEQASSYCINELQAQGIRVGAPATTSIPATYPGSGRICPGSDVVLGEHYSRLGGASAPHTDACSEGTTWPLRP